MKYLGIDYGSKRVGIAISDPGGRLAFPTAVLENKEDLLKIIREIAVKEQVEGIVLGESRNYQGQPNKIMKEVEAFAESLRQNIELPIYYEPEFLTSFQAENTQYKLEGDKANLDASSAALILQSFLDKKNQSL